jgi:hypothetical protein
MEAQLARMGPRHGRCTSESQHRCGSSSSLRVATDSLPSVLFGAAFCSWLFLPWWLMLACVDVDSAQEGIDERASFETEVQGLSQGLDSKKRSLLHKTMQKLKQSDHC